MTEPSTRDGGSDLCDFGLRVRDFDNEVVILLVVQFDDYGVVRIVHVIEDATAVLIEGAGGNDTGNLCAWEPDAQPPSARCFSVDGGPSDVRDRYGNLALEGPELVHPLHFENCISVRNGYLDQWCSAPLQERKIRVQR